MSEQRDLFPETIRRPRGRPRNPNAMSGAQRMAKLRRRAKDALSGQDESLESMSDTGIIEALRIAMQTGDAGQKAAIAEELARRAAGKPDETPARTPRAAGTPYPNEVRAKAIRWRKKGCTFVEIDKRIKAELGRSPGPSNLRLRMKAWATEPSVIEILDQGGEP